jgi:O-acetyl-ADP-ribose deacetylase (regulator of RNase III)
MQAMISNCRLDLVQGDITGERVDAIVNAANAGLLGGGGVDGAIHRAGGPDIMDETRRLFPDGCPTGSAVASGAGLLSAKFIFHAVGPVWRGGRAGEPELLAAAYRSCLDLAVARNCDSIAFPAISTGVYGYPIDLAARIAIETTRDFLVRKQRPGLVRFVLFSEGAYGAFARVVESLVSASASESKR